MTGPRRSEKRRVARPWIALTPVLATCMLLPGCRMMGAAVDFSLDLTDTAVETSLHLGHEALSGARTVVGLRPIAPVYQHESRRPGPATRPHAPTLSGSPPQHHPIRFPSAFLGIRFRAPTDGLLEIPQSPGVRVEEVIAGSSAARSGLQPGDVITALGGIGVHSPEDLMLAVRLREVGEEVEISFLRRGSSFTIKVQLGSV